MICISTGWVTSPIGQCRSGALASVGLSPPPPPSPSNAPASAATRRRARLEFDITGVPLQGEDVGLDLGIVIEEYIAVLTDVGDTTEGIAAVVGLQRVLGVDFVAAEVGRRRPLIVAVPP